MFTDALAPDGYDRVHQGYADRIIVPRYPAMFTSTSSAYTVVVIIGMACRGAFLLYQTLTA